MLYTETWNTWLAWTKLSNKIDFLLNLIPCKSHAQSPVVKLPTRAKREGVVMITSLHGHDFRITVATFMSILFPSFSYFAPALHFQISNDRKIPPLNPERVTVTSRVAACWEWLATILIWRKVLWPTHMEKVNKVHVYDRADGCAKYKQGRLNVISYQSVISILYIVHSRVAV